MAGAEVLPQFLAGYKRYRTSGPLPRPGREPAVQSNAAHAARRTRTPTEPGSPAHPPGHGGASGLR